MKLPKWLCCIGVQPNPDDLKKERILEDWVQAGVLQSTQCYILRHFELRVLQRFDTGGKLLARFLQPLLMCFYQFHSRASNFALAFKFLEQEVSKLFSYIDSMPLTEIDDVDNARYNALRALAYFSNESLKKEIWYLPESAAIFLGRLFDLANDKQRKNLLALLSSNVLTKVTVEQRVTVLSFLHDSYQSMREVSLGVVDYFVVDHAVGVREKIAKELQEYLLTASQSQRSQARELCRSMRRAAKTLLDERYQVLACFFSYAVALVECQTFSVEGLGYQGVKSEIAKRNLADNLFQVFKKIVPTAEKTELLKRFFQDLLLRIVVLDTTRSSTNHGVVDTGWLMFEMEKQARVLGFALQFGHGWSRLLHQLLLIYRKCKLDPLSTESSINSCMQRCGLPAEKNFQTYLIDHLSTAGSEISVAQILIPKHGFCFANFSEREDAVKIAMGRNKFLIKLARRFFHFILRRSGDGNVDAKKLLNWLVIDCEDEIAESMSLPEDELEAEMLKFLKAECASSAVKKEQYTKLYHTAEEVFQRKAEEFYKQFPYDAVSSLQDNYQLLLRLLAPACVGSGASRLRTISSAVSAPTLATPPCRNAVRLAEVGMFNSSGAFAATRVLDDYEKVSLRQELALLVRLYAREPLRLRLLANRRPSTPAQANLSVGVGAGTMG